MRPTPRDLARPPRALRQPASSLVLVAGLALCACNFQVPSSSYLSGTRLVSVAVEVVELGPLNPDRVGLDTGAAIAEPMPHDRVAFEAVVVDEDGLRLPAEELETLWFQCGAFDCGTGGIGVGNEIFERDCEELGEGDEAFEPLTMDSICRLGAGDGRFEFELPELGQLMVERRVASYYGVVAWNGRSAQSCWEGRREGDELLDDCAFIQRAVKIGPSWWMLVYAETIGLSSPIPIYEIPAGVFIQAANRVPLVSFSVIVDGELQGEWPQQTQFQAPPGARIEVASHYDEAVQFLQTYFVGQPVGDTGSWVFTAAGEALFEIVFTSNAIVLVEDELPFAGPEADSVHHFAVDEYAEAGRSRIVLVYFDDRYGEDVAILEFEVTPP